MANQRKEGELDLVSTWSKVEKYIDENKNLVSGAGLALVIMIAGLVWYQIDLSSKNELATEKIFRAQNYFEIDSLNLALNGDASGPGFLEIVEEYGGTKIGNLANYYVGMCYFKQGHYEESIKYLKEFDSDDMFAQSLAWASIGDAYSEIGDLKKSISFYKKAIYNNPNELITPFLLMKTGLALEKNQNYSEAKKIFETIQTEYPQSTEGKSADKYIARVQARL